MCLKSDEVYGKLVFDSQVVSGSFFRPDKFCSLNKDSIGSNLSKFEPWVKNIEKSTFW